jgi:hypothetical protein
MDEEEYAIWRRWVGDARERLWEGAGTFEEALNEELDPTIRAHAAHLFGKLTSTAWGQDSSGVESVPRALIRRLAVETQPLVRASIALALGPVGRVEPHALEMLGSLLVGDTAPAVRLSAAMALSEVEPELRPEAVVILNEALVDMDCTDRLFAGNNSDVDEWASSRLAPGYRAAGFDPTSRKPGDLASGVWFPWFTLRPSHHVIKAVCRLSPRGVSQVLPGITNALKQDSDSSFAYVSEPILKSVFRDGRVNGKGGLTDTQRRVLTAFCDNPATWSRKDVRQEFLLTKLGLPPAAEDSRREWEELLGR